MKNISRASGLIMLMLMTASAPAQNNDQYAIRNVTIIPMNQEESLFNQTIIIQNGVISRIGDASKVKIPDGFQIINGLGKFLIPGLFDMHAHFFYEQGDNVNTCEKELKMMLANGLTTVRIECGDPAYLQAPEKVKTREWVGPKIFVASPQFVGAWPWPGKVFGAICKTPQEAEIAVRQFKSEGYDELKITFMVKRDVYDAIIRTAKETGIKVTGHVGPLVRLPAALAAKEQIEHMDEFIDMLLPDASYNHGQSVSDMNIWRKKAWATVPYLDESRLPSLVSSVKASGIYVTPTNYFFFSSFGDSIPEDQFKQRPDFDFIPPKIKQERWSIRDRYWKAAPPESSRKKYIDLRKKMTYGLWKAGVPLMAGSDSPEWFLVQGFSIHDEIETFVKSGLSPFAALQTATINPATYLQVDNQKGTIEVGKDADLVLLDKNPMEDIRNTRTIHGVLIGKTWFDSQGVKRLLEESKPISN